MNFLTHKIPFLTYTSYFEFIICLFLKNYKKQQLLGRTDFGVMNTEKIPRGSSKYQNPQ